jgi:cytoskeletal protein CcmA (bactofilin family)
MPRIRHLPLLAALLVGLLLSTCLAAPARAQDAVASAGNVLSLSNQPNPISGDATVEHDLYWAGQSLTLGAATVKGDVIAAGQSLVLDGTSVGGNVRCASQTLSVRDVNATNITCAGQTLDIDGTTSANAAYLAGQDVTFSGTANSAMLAGKTVTVDGTVTGDVSISADTVTIGPDADIEGTLHVDATSEPTIPASAHVGSLDFNLTKSDSNEQASTVITGLFGLSLLHVLFGIASGCLVALLLTLLLPVAVDGSAACVRQRTAAMLVSGVVGVLVVVPAFVVLLILVATIPLAFALLLAFIALCLVAVPFSGASLARVCLPGWNRFGAAAAGGAVLGLAAAIPLLGVIVSFASVVYLTGYVIQSVWAGIHAPTALEQEAAKKDALPEGHATCDGIPVPPQGPAPDDTPDA